MKTALDEFLERYGDNDPNKKKSQTTPLKIDEVRLSQDDLDNAEDGYSDPDNAPKGLKKIGNKIRGGNTTYDDDTGTESTTLNLKEKIGKGAKLAGQGLAAVTQGAQLIDNLKGGQFDTSADGGGPGKAGGAILSGAATGKQFADSLGLKDPLSQGIATIGGGLISTFSHSKAMKEYKKNQKTANLKKNALEHAKLEDEYNMQKGLASMDALKNLRKKQLGYTR